MNFEPGTIRRVAQHLPLGDLNEQLSSETELRFGTHGSMSLDVEKNTFYDHQQKAGGGLLDLICRETDAENNAEAMQWMVDKGLAQAEPAKKVKAIIVATYDYRDESGELLFQVVRMQPKTFRQRRPNGTGWEYKVKGTRQVPYRLPDLVAAPLNQQVYVVEGEKDVDRLAKLGVIATCNAGGAGKWHKAHAEPLKDRAVIVIPDNDEAGRDHAQKVAKSLKGIAADVRILELPDLPEKGDVVDWLDAGGTAEQLAKLPTSAPAALNGEGKGDDEDEEEKKRSQTDLLVAFAREHYELLHDRNGDVYARELKTNEVRRLGGRQFKDRLTAAFYNKTQMAVRESSLREVLGTLQALGRFNGEPAQTVNIRVAKHAECYYLDLCEPGNSRAVELGAGQWRIVDDPPVLFVRGEAMQPLPTPMHGGSLTPLWSSANVPKNLRPLVVAWLIDSMRPDTPYLGLELIGEQGSGKSTATDAFRRIIDPSACNLRGAPKTVEDLFVCAGQNHIVAYENVSHLAGPMQDALAILSIGGGYSKRTLYSNDDEHIISVRRPWMVNGIVISVTQQDLVDRVISIECPVIQELLLSSGQCREFDTALPGILGGLLDTAAKALAVLPDMKLPAADRPRLVEYVLLGMAVAQASGDKPATFLKTFNELRAETVARTLDSSPVAAAVLEFVEKMPGGMEASVKDILAQLELYRPMGADAWPRTPKGLGDALRRAAPALRQMDVDCKCMGKIGGAVKWAIKRKSRSQSPASPEVLATSPGNDDCEQDIRTFRTSQSRLTADAAHTVAEL